MSRYPNEIDYSPKYEDGSYEYRHVTLTKEAAEEMLALPSTSQHHT